MGDGFAGALLEKGLAGSDAGRRRSSGEFAAQLGRVEEALWHCWNPNASPDPMSSMMPLSVFLAMILADVGREREALSLTLDVLAHLLPRYQRSMATYGRVLVEPGVEET